MLHSKRPTGVIHASAWLYEGCERPFGVRLFPSPIATVSGSCDLAAGSGHLRVAPCLNQGLHAISVQVRTMANRQGSTC